MNEKSLLAAAELIKTHLGECTHRLEIIEAGEELAHAVPELVAVCRGLRSWLRDILRCVEDGASVPDSWIYGAHLTLQQSERLK